MVQNKVKYSYETNNDGEYISIEFNKHLKFSGISRQKRKLKTILKTKAINRIIRKTILIYSYKMMKKPENTERVIMILINKEQTLKYCSRYFNS